MHWPNPVTRFQTQADNRMITIEEYERLKKSVFAKHKPEAVALATTIGYFERALPPSDKNRIYYGVFWTAIQPYMKSTGITPNSLELAAADVNRMLVTMATINGYAD